MGWIERRYALPAPSPPQAVQAARSARCRRLWAGCYIQHLGLSLSAALQDRVWDRGRDCTDGIGRGGSGRAARAVGLTAERKILRPFSVEKTKLATPHIWQI